MSHEKQQIDLADDDHLYDDSYNLEHLEEQEIEDSWESSKITLYSEFYQISKQPLNMFLYLFIVIGDHQRKNNKLNNKVSNNYSQLLSSWLLFPKIIRVKKV